MHKRYSVSSQLASKNSSKEDLGPSVRYHNKQLHDSKWGYITGVHEGPMSIHEPQTGHTRPNLHGLVLSAFCSWPIGARMLAQSLPDPPREMLVHHIDQAVAPPTLCLCRHMCEEHQSEQEFHFLRCELITPPSKLAINPRCQEPWPILSCA